MAEKEYQRLTRARLRRTGALAVFATRSSLWLGKDHLLCIDSTGGYAEEYKRFYFRDIQAITLRKTKRRPILNWILAVPLAMCSAVLIVGLVDISRRPFQTDDYWGFVGWGTPFALVLGLMIINTLRGPGCVCHLRTAVQTEVLPSLNRLRRARKVLDRIRPLVAAAQGTLSPEEIASHLANPASPDAPPVIARFKTAPKADPPRHYSGAAHLVLFWLLLADVPLSAVDISFHSDWLDLASVLLLLVTVACVIASLIKQHNTTLPAALKRLPWIVLGWIALVVLTAIGYGMFLVINDPKAVDRTLSPLDDPVVLVMTVISTTVSAALGIMGLMLLRKYRSSSFAPGPPAAGGPSAT